MSTTQKPSLHLRPATDADFPSLADVFYKAFHPVSPYMRRAQPDTPLVRAFWNEAHTYSLNDPNVRLMVVVDKSAEPERIIAQGRFRAPSSDTTTTENLDAGVWPCIPLTADHDAEMCNAFIDFIVLCRQKQMTGKRHYFIELLACSHEYKGCGAGRLLLEWVCAESDKENAAIFVQTNSDIVKFYERFGLNVVDRLEMPGGLGYEEFIMVRPAETTTREH